MVWVRLLRLLLYPVAMVLVSLSPVAPVAIVLVSLSPVAPVAPETGDS